jgi:protein TonB
VQVQSSLLPLPAGTVAIVTPGSNPGLPPELDRPVNGPVAPPAEPAASAPASKPALPVGGKVQDAQIVDRTVPEYPALARKRGVSGTVHLEAVVDERGAVTNVKVVSGDAVLAAAARSAVQKWKYKAATLNGLPVASKVAIQVLFGDRK